MHADEQGGAPADQDITIAQSTPNASSTTVTAESAETGPPAASNVNAASGSGIFRGRIIDAVSRQPVREFDLEFQPPRRMIDSPAPPFHSFKTKDGRFECRGVPAGVWTIFAKARGYQRFELPAVAIADDQAAQEVLIPMRPGQALKGRVFDEATDAGIAGATLNFREAHVDRYDGDFRMRPSTLSQKNGAFVLDGLPEGRIVIAVHAKNYASRELEVAIGNKQAPVEIGLSTGGTIAGYLAGTDGLTPVSGMISLLNLDEGSGGSMPTGATGEFDFRQLSPARYMLSGRANGLSGDREITISHNEQMEGIVLAMRGGHSIRGLVSGLRPDDLRFVNVSAERDGEYDLSGGVTVDERGAFTIAGVPPGRVRVSALVPSRRHLAKTVEMPADTDLTVNLEFPRGARLTGRVTRGGKPLSGAAVSPQLAGNSADPDFYIYEVGTAANGDYVIDDVPHGEYVVRVGSYRSSPVRISGDTVFDVDIPAAQLAGRLIEEGGKVPVVGATVDVRPSQPNPARAFSRSDTSDHFGQFALRGMQPGDYVLSVYKPGYEMYRAPLSYGTTIADLVIGLRRARGVEIKVRNASTGKPVRSVYTQEVLNGQPGMLMQLNLDENGVGYLPSAMTGSSLKFMAMYYAPTTITAWNGQGLELDLQPRSQP